MTVTITQITTHQADGKARLPGFLANATNFKAFLDVLITPYQDIEDLFIDILDGLSLDTAVGVQLDVIGEIIQLDRTSATEPDDEYRTRLRGEAAALARSGEVETLITVWNEIWQAVKTIVTEYQPATVELAAEVTTDSDDDDLDAAALASIEAAKAGGVGLIPIIGETPLFLWGDVADADANGDINPVPGDSPGTDNGWGDEADADANGDITPGTSQGGNFARLLE